MLKEIRTRGKNSLGKLSYRQKRRIKVWLAQPATWDQLLEPTLEANEDLIAGAESALSGDVDRGQPSTQAVELATLAKAYILASLQLRDSIPALSQQVRTVGQEVRQVATSLERLGGARNHWPDIQEKLSPRVVDQLEILHGDSPELAEQLGQVLMDRRSTPKDVVNSIANSAPPWFQGAPSAAWLALGRFAADHQERMAARQSYIRAAELEPGWAGRHLAEAALVVADVDSEAARADLARARGLPGGALLADAYSPLLEGRPEEVPESVLVLDEGRLLAEPALMSRVAEASIAAGDLDAGIRHYDALAQAHPSSDSIAMRLAYLLTDRARLRDDPRRREDLDRARELAKNVRDSRRRWAGPSEEAVALLARLLLEAGNPRAALEMCLPPLRGSASDREARASAVAAIGAQAAIRVGELALADELSSRVTEPSVAVTVDALRIEANNADPEDQREAWERVLESSDNDNTRSAALMKLAYLGRWPLPEAGELADSEMTEIVLAIGEATQGRLTSARGLLRPLLGRSMRACMVLAELLVDAGQLSEAIDTLRAALLRFDDMPLRMLLLGVLIRDKQYERAEEEALDALTNPSLEPPVKAQLRRFCIEERSRRGDWPGVEAAARAALREGHLTDENAWSLIAAIWNRRRLDDAWSTYQELKPTVRSKLEFELWMALHHRFEFTSTDVEEALQHVGLYDGDRSLQTAVVAALIDASSRMDRLSPVATQALSFAVERLRADVGDESMPFERLDLDEVDITEFFRHKLEGPAQLLESLAAQVRAAQIPLGRLAGAVGRPYGQALIQRAAGVTPAATPLPDEFEEEVRAFEGCRDGDCVVDLSALYVALILDRWSDIRSQFNRVLISTPSMDDLLKTKSALRTLAASSGQLSYNPRLGRLINSTMDQETSGRLLRMVDELETVALQLDMVQVDSLTTLIDLPWELDGPWAAAIDLAIARGVPVLTDDVVMRRVTREKGGLSFGTLAVLGVVLDDAPDRESSEELVVQQLLAEYVVDLPMIPSDLLQQAEKDNYSLGAASANLARPAFWLHDPAGSLATWNFLAARVRQRNPQEFGSWAYSATVGLTSLTEAAAGKLRAAHLLARELTAGGLDQPAPGLVKAVQEAAEQNGVGDPWPAAVVALFEAAASTIGRAAARELVIRMLNRYPNDLREPGMQVMEEQFEE